MMNSPTATTAIHDIEYYKSRVDALEKENRELKRSVFELSSTLSELQWALRKARARPFEIGRQPAPARMPEPVELTRSLSNKMGGGGVVATPGAVVLARRGISTGSIASSTHSSTSALPIRTDSNSQGDAIVLDDEDHRSQFLVDGRIPLVLGSSRSHDGELGYERDIDLLLLQQQQRAPHLQVHESDLRFRCAEEFTEHKGAVYCVKWSPNGAMVASGSFDKSVYIRSMSSFILTGEDMGDSPKSFRFAKHERLISDLKWSSDCRYLLSGSFDHTIKLWSIERATSVPNNSTSAIATTSSSSSSSSSSSQDSSQQQMQQQQDQKDMSALVHSFAVEGLVQTVEFDPESGDRVLFGGTGKGTIVRIDTRMKSDAGTLKNECLSFLGGGNHLGSDAHGSTMINTIHIPISTPNLLISGDSKGVVNTWDLRMDRCVEELAMLNEPAGRPITHITTPFDKHLRWMAVNSYDNILRVYDRSGAIRFNSPQPMIPTGSGAALEALSTSSIGSTNSSVTSDHQFQQQNPPASLPCLYSLTGHRNKNWPIKSSFYCNPGAKASPRAGPPSSRDRGGASTVSSERAKQSSSNSILLATGSASTSVYIFGLSEEATLVQKLKGHSGRVYSCDFASTNSLPILASCSADSTVRVWVVQHKS